MRVTFLRRILAHCVHHISLLIGTHGSFDMGRIFDICTSYKNNAH